MVMLHLIPKHILTIKKKFVESGFKLYLVGGCVRDMITARPMTDWDLTTDATPEEMIKLFPEAFYDNSFGTVGIPIINDLETEHTGVVEITTFRTERGYDDR